MYFTYLKCDAGKFGPRCEKECPYPLYENLCAYKCYCNQDICNPSEGCSGKCRITYVHVAYFNYSGFFPIVREMNMY